MSSISSLTEEPPPSPFSADMQPPRTPRRVPYTPCFSFSCEDIKQDSSLSSDTTSRPSPHMSGGTSGTGSQQSDNDTRFRSSSLSRVELRVTSADQSQESSDRNRADSLGTSSLSLHEKRSRLMKTRHERPLRRRTAQVICPLARTQSFTSLENRSTFTQPIRVSSSLKSAQDTCLSEQNRICHSSIPLNITANCEDKSKLNDQKRLACIASLTPHQQKNASGNASSCSHTQPLGLSTLSYPTKHQELENSEINDVLPKDNSIQPTNGGPNSEPAGGKYLSSHQIKESSRITKILDDMNRVCQNTISTMKSTNEKVANNHAPLKPLRSICSRSNNAGHYLETHISEPIFSKSLLPNSPHCAKTQHVDILACPQNGRLCMSQCHSAPRLTSIENHPDQSKPLPLFVTDTSTSVESSTPARQESRDLALPGSAQSDQNRRSTENIDNRTDPRDCGEVRASVIVQEFQLTTSKPCVHRETEAGWLEQEHVYQVYKRIAPQCDHFRHKAWPRVTKFLKDLQPGALVADIGCGSGRYLGINNQIIKFGSDTCRTFLDKARSQGFEVTAADNFALPFRSVELRALSHYSVLTNV